MRADSEHPEIWQKIHDQDRRTTVLEVEMQTLKDTQTKFQGCCTDRHEKLESRFTTTLDTMSKAVVGIDTKLETFMARTEAVDEQKAKSWNLLTPFILALTGLIGWGFEKIFVH